MAGKVQDLTGQKFGRLTVLSLAKVEKGYTHWHCRCMCGVEKVIAAVHLKSGGTKSCGCLLAKINGLRSSPEYSTWANMMQRCFNPNIPEFKHYGGRGISVCDRWRYSFLDFYSDMGPRPNAKYSIERIDVNGNYEPSNCKWADFKEQANNKRNNLRVAYSGRMLTISELVETTGTAISESTVRVRLKNGWSVDDAISVPTVQKYFYRGKEFSLNELAKEVNMKFITLYDRLVKNGMSVEEAVSKPVRKYR